MIRACAIFDTVEEDSSTKIGSLERRLITVKIMVFPPELGRSTMKFIASFCHWRSGISSGFKSLRFSSL